MSRSAQIIAAAAPDAGTTRVAATAPALAVSGAASVDGGARDGFSDAGGKAAEGSDSEDVYELEEAGEETFTCDTSGNVIDDTDAFGARRDGCKRKTAQWYEVKDFSTTPQGLPERLKTLWCAVVRVHKGHPTNGQPISHGTGTLLVLDELKQQALMRSHYGQPTLGVLTNFHVAHYSVNNVAKLAKQGAHVQQGQLAPLNIDLDFEIGQKPTQLFDGSSGRAALPALVRHSLRV